MPQLQLRDRRRTPPVELLTRGQVSPRALMLVSYVDEDASGELRLVQQVPDWPVQPTYPPAA